MKYLCLIYQDEHAVQKLPPEEFQKLHAEYVALVDALQQSGQLLGHHGLQPTQTATTVRVRQDDVVTTDGPFAETKEQLGGIFLIEAADMQAATQVAAKIPSARFGSIEVRPVWT